MSCLGERLKDLGVSCKKTKDKQKATWTEEVRKQHTERIEEYWNTRKTRTDEVKKRGKS